jgi:hypothetical protein
MLHRRNDAHEMQAERRLGRREVCGGDAARFGYAAAGAVHQGVEPTEAIDGIRDGLRHVGLDRYVAASELRPTSQPAGELLAFALPTPCNHDLRAALGKKLRCTSTDPTGSSDDQRS